MNKRQAKFIMQLPDGYKWRFIDIEDRKFICGASGKELLIYEMVDGELVQIEVNFDMIYGTSGVDSDMHGKIGRA